MLATLKCIFLHKRLREPGILLTQPLADKFALLGVVCSTYYERTDEGDPAEECAVVGGEDGGAEGEEGDHDAVQHHPRQQEPRKRKKKPGFLNGTIIRIALHVEEEEDMYFL